MSIRKIDSFFRKIGIFKAINTHDNSELNWKINLEILKFMGWHLKLWTCGKKHAL